MQFKLPLPIDESYAPDIVGRIRLTPIEVGRSTFLAGLAKRVHRWFRLTPSFGADLVHHLLAETETQPGSRILDPFAGAGTTLIEAKLEGHHALGFEINPVLHFVCETSVSREYSADSLRCLLEDIRHKYVKATNSAGQKSIEDLGLTVPPIHNPLRWWRPDVLRDLLILRDCVDAATETDPAGRGFMRLALAGVLVPDLTNVTLGRLQLHFVDRSEDKIEVWETFSEHVSSMIEDVVSIERVHPIGTARIFHTDATAPNLPADLPLVDRVITSPPYPNRYSYVWNTRPHLYFLGFFSTAKEASDLDLRTIGGTWGTATSVLQKGVVPYEIAPMATILGPVVDEIRRSDNLMANYVVKYFNLLVRQIRAQHRLLAPDAQLAYVVGCSRIKGVYVETDVLLARIFEALDLGYTVSAVERFRRRHSGKDLFESTVLVRRQP